MIRTFKHKGLEQYLLRGSTARIPSKHEKRIRLVFGRLHASTCPDDMDLPGLFLHELKRRSRGRWSVRVSGNWRITFKFDGIDAVDVNYEDYH